MAAITNALIDSFGATFKENYSNLYNEFCKKITDYMKVMEAVKINFKSADIKSKVNMYTHFIKKNLNSIKKNFPTAIFKY